MDKIFKTIKNKRTIIFVLIILWTLFIWENSIDTNEVSQDKSQYVVEKVEPIVNVKAIDKDMVSAQTNFIVRKAAHITEFLVLSVLWSVYIGCFSKERSQIHKIILTICICLLVAVIDESIQIFSVGRTASVKDVFIDLSGIVLGRFILYKV